MNPDQYIRAKEIAVEMESRIAESELVVGQGRITQSLIDDAKANLAKLKQAILDFEYETDAPNRRADELLDGL